MKPIYKSLTLAAMTLQVSLALNAQTYDGTDTSETALPAEILDSLRVELVAPNVSGARDLIKSGECAIDGSDLSITLNAANWFKGATYRVQVVATFGTQTQVIYALDVTVPYYATISNESQEYEDTVTVVSTIGDGTGSTITVDPTPTEGSTNPVASGGVYNDLVGKADSTVYAKDGDGSAHITKPLNVSGSVSEGSSYGEVFEINVVVLTPEQKAEVEAETGTAYDYCDASDSIPDGENVTIYADEECTQKVGSTTKTEFSTALIEGDFFNLQDGESIAAGTYYARKERGIIGTNSHAEGDTTTASGNNSHAEGNGATASGNNSHAEGNGTTARGDNSHAEGDGTTARGSASHAEGDDTTASGTNSHAEGYTTTASGDNSHAEGNGTTAIGDNSHAEGLGTIASRDNQHVCGQYNVEDENDSFQFIVGNGTDIENRRNAFAVTKSGELALFEADGTPVILDPATLKALIASV